MLYSLLPKTTLCCFCFSSKNFSNHPLVRTFPELTELLKISLNKCQYYWVIHVPESTGIHKNLLSSKTELAFIFLYWAYKKNHYIGICFLVLTLVFVFNFLHLFALLLKILFQLLSRWTLKHGPS